MQARPGLSEDEFRARRDALRAEVAQLSREERRELEKAKDRFDEKRQNNEFAKYYAMSPDERKAVIDREVARALAKAQQRAKARPAADNQAGGTRSGGGQGQSGNNKSGNNQSGAAQNGGNGNRPTRTPEQYDISNRERLLQTTPQARAGREQKRLDLATARAQAGLPPK
jgi:hypothetical protein